MYARFINLSFVIIDSCKRATFALGSEVRCMLHHSCPDDGGRCGHVYDPLPSPCMWTSCVYVLPPRLLFCFGRLSLVRFDPGDSISPPASASNMTERARIHLQIATSYSCLPACLPVLSGLHLELRNDAGRASTGSLSLRLPASDLCLLGVVAQHWRSSKHDVLDGGTRAGYSMAHMGMYVSRYSPLDYHQLT